MIYQGIDNIRQQAFFQEKIINPDTPLVNTVKIEEQQTVKLSIELAPYIQSYKNYKHAVDMNNISNANASDLIGFKQAYETQRTKLLDGLTPLTGGRWEDVFNLAMPVDNADFKHSTAYQVLEDSFVEILSNTVDEMIAKQMESSRNIRPVNTLKAVLSVTIDTQSQPGKISIICTDNGRGFKNAFLEKVDSADAQQLYTHQKTSSNKRTSMAKSISPDIDIFVGGRGLGLKMLVRKVQEDSSLDPAQKATIQFDNIKDSHGKTTGARTIITSLISPEKELVNTPVEKINAIKEQLKHIRRNSPLTINTDFSDEDNSPRYWGPGS